MKAGEDKAWEELAALDPHTVCRDAGAEWDEAVGVIRIPLFGLPVDVDVAARSLRATEPRATLLLERFAYFSHLALLRYLIGARPIAPSGRLVKPADLGPGQIYYEGSHVLPLARLATVYGEDAAALRRRGDELNAATAPFGDAALRLLPLPRLPTTVILWLADEEFPARADLLFDETCEQHLPPDALWAVAMLSTLALL